MRLYQRTKLSTLPIMQIMAFCLLSTLLSACFQKSLPIAENNPNLGWSKRNQALQDLRQWSLSGKAAFQTGNDAGTATFKWQQQQDQFSFTAFNPLGSEAFRLQGSPGKVTLTMSDGKKYTAPSSEILFSRTVGFQFPFSSLVYWVRGLPNPNLPVKAEFDTSHRLAQLQQANWQVEFQNYTNVAGLDLPRFIIMTSPPYKAKVMIYSWNRNQ
jgi:outer membrane lipoprotein LolB